MASASLDDLFQLLLQQLPDHSFERHEEGRWVIARRTRNIMHSDSTNPQSETNVTADLYDLRSFQDGSLFSSALSKGWSAWRSRGGSSGFIGSIDFTSDEVVEKMEGKVTKAEKP